MIIWSQYGWGIIVFREIGDEYYSILLVDGIIANNLKEFCGRGFFASQKVNCSGTGHKELKLLFHQKILIYNSLGEIIFIYGESPGI